MDEVQSCLNDVQHNLHMRLNQRVKQPADVDILLEDISVAIFLEGTRGYRLGCIAHGFVSWRFVTF